MPEMPEVEITRRSLSGRIAGAQILSTSLGKPLRWPLGIEPQALVGLTIGPVARRGKYLWFPLVHTEFGVSQSDQASCHEGHQAKRHEGGCDAGGLLMHLGMSGSLGFGPNDLAKERGPHDHFELMTTQGVLRLSDPRRFGAVVWSPAMDQGLAGKLLSGLGHEPFDPALTGQVMWQAWRGRSSSIKACVLAGDVVVGAGNIYVCEALFASGIDPRTPARLVSRARCELLLVALREVLQKALDFGGSSLRDFKDTHGLLGQFQEHAGVYGREGQACGRCQTKIRRVVQTQRSTFFCPQCQRR